MPRVAARRDAVSWPLATVTALLVPGLVFWTFILMSPAMSARPGLVSACVMWLALGVLLSRAQSRWTRGWGLGLSAGALACLPWALAGVVS